MTKLILISLSILISQIALYGQISFEKDTIAGRNSEEIEIELNVETTNEISEIEFDLLLSNPTVCYLNDIVEQDLILSNELLAKENGLFSVKLRVRNGIETVKIRSKLLSGNDSVSTIRLFNVKIDSNEFPEDSATIKNILFDNSGPYVRFLTSNSPYPNPIISGGIETIVFYNDIALKVQILVCNSDGYIFVNSNRFYEKGKNSFEIITSELPAGAYYVSIYSQIGNSIQQFVVIK